jgi:hypothetical protein
MSDGKQVEEGAGSDLGWWVIHGGVLMELMQRAAAGEDPDMLYAEHYANCDHTESSPRGRREDMVVNMTGDWGDYVVLDELTECSNNSAPLYLLREIWSSLGAPDTMTVTVIADGQS